MSKLAAISRQPSAPILPFSVSPRMRLARHTRRPNRTGTTSVEFAFIAPVLFLIVFGSIEITRMSLLLNLAQDACYDAARHAIVEGSNTSEAVAKAQSVLSLFATQNAQISINNGAGISADQRDLTVTITIPMRDNAFVLKQFYTGRFITASITMRMERYNGYYDGNL